MTGTLTPDQGAALLNLTEFAKSRSRTDWGCSLQGFAGCGKSYLLPHLLTELPQATTALVAPTNKAVKVLNGFLARNGVRADTMTIHKLLGLKPEWHNGVQRLQQTDEALAVADYSLVVCDEASMVGADLYGYILRAHADYGTRFMFVGDPLQLPPVNEMDSLTLALPGPVLDKPIRQREESALLALLTDIRAMIQRGMCRIPYVPEGPGLEVVPDAQSFELVRGLFGASFDKDPDAARIIAYRNEAVRGYNNTVQGMRYPDLDALFAVGEPVVFSSPAMENTEVGRESAPHKNVMFQTESEGVVTAPPAAAEHPTAKVAAWKVPVRSADTGERATVWALGHKERAEWKAYCNTLAADARAGRRGWWEFYRAVEVFADVRPAYSLTAHKAQGSTFGTVLVDVLDIMNGNRNKEEALRCLYVALSRASERAVVNAGFPRPIL